MNNYEFLLSIDKKTKWNIDFISNKNIIFVFVLQFGGIKFDLNCIQLNLKHRMSVYINCVLVEFVINNYLYCVPGFFCT